MRWLIVWAASVATAFSQGGNLSGTVFDLDTGRTQVISIRQSEDDYVANLRKQTLEGYRRMNAELEVSIANMRQESELRQQTRELREQTELLRNMSKEAGGGYSSTYVPPPTYDAPSIYSSATTIVDPPDPAMRKAKFANSFRTDLVERMKHGPKDYGLFNNEEIIKRLIATYKGDFTEYGWRTEKIDSQTFMVICEVSLDGQKHDFRFKVNTEVETCRYEGGTALEKLAPAPTPRETSTPPPIPDSEPTTSASSSFDPDEYLREETASQNKPPPASDGTKPWEQFGDKE